MESTGYAEYNGLDKPLDEEKVNIVQLLKNAPSTFWKVGLVQFFCWAAFMYMWTYTNGTIADTCWEPPMWLPLVIRRLAIGWGILFAIPGSW